MRRNRIIWPSAVLVCLYACAWLAPVLSPNPPERQFRQFPAKDPTPVRFRSPEGRWSLRPSIQDYEAADRPNSYRTTGRFLPIRFFVTGEPYRWMGFTLETRLIGLQNGDKRIFLLGTDSLGRDVFSRVLHGARISLTIGLAAVLLSGLTGVLLGSLAGYRSGWTDASIMRMADVFFSLPALFLLMGVRVLFPTDLSTGRAFWMMVLAFSLMGWAIFARVIRGQVLGLKNQSFVEWSRACGASHWWILRKHILPFTLNTLLVQSMVLIPGFILSEVTLSFLGMGVQQPDPSWGNLLAEASNLSVMTRQPWMLSPGLFLLVSVLCFNLIADGVKGVERQRRVW